NLSPDQPEGYSGLGLWSEDHQLWDEADDWYKQAIDVLRRNPAIKDLFAALEHLLLPMSGNTYFQLARSLKDDHPDYALKAVERALEFGVKHSISRPEKLVYRLKGEILDKLGRQSDAAEAYFEA